MLVNPYNIERRKRMSRKFKIGLVGLLVIAALTAMTSSTVLAQEETPEPAPKTYGPHGWGRGFGRGFGGEVGLEAIAEALGMTTDELSLQLWGGKTLADLAEEAGVDLQDLQDAVIAAQEAATREAIEQAVEDGTLTREHADWLLEGLDNGYWGGRGFGGFGGCGGRGGFHGRGGFGGFRGNTGFGRSPYGNGPVTGTNDA
jgi:hypothetical protein